MSDEILEVLARVEAEQKRQAKVLQNIADMATEFHQEVFPGSVERPSLLTRVSELEKKVAVHCDNGGAVRAVK